MTIHISLRFLLFVLYTGALLGGAFGISYAVFEWRGDDVNSPAVSRCWEDARERFIENDKMPPDSPANDSGSAYVAYRREFAAVKAHNELNWDEYNQRVVDCFP